MSSDINMQSTPLDSKSPHETVVDNSEYDTAVSVRDLSKVYQIYDHPEDRLRQSLYPRFHRLIGREPRNYFHEFWALKDVSFDVKRGETVGIVGRNGSGKSTLLQLICGTLQPSRGVVETHGRVAALLELGSGFNPEFTGRENVYMNAAILGLSKAEVDKRYDDIAAFADIGQFIDQPVKAYSSGMTVRLAFAVAINVDPEILIIDEALSVGDELFQRKCFSRIETIKDDGATILFVSHSGGTVVQLCDRAVLLDEGEKLVAGVPKVIVGHYHKLLFASQDKYETIRHNIRKLSDDSIETGSADEIPSTNQVRVFPKTQVDESFDSNFKPSSTIEYESRGASIQSAKITTLSGKQVNQILRGEAYRFSYTVKFSERSPKVRFGMLIKTTSGVELGGASSAGSLEESVGLVEAGESYRVEFRFECNLNPGSYFMNAGVLGFDDGCEIYLSRVIDILAFKVMPEVSHLGTGIVDFGCSAKAERIY